MKKLLILFFVATLTLSCLTVTACGKKKPNNDDPPTPPSPPAQTETIEDKEIIVDSEDFN